MPKDSWDNYNGLQVPPKHGDLFRAMDQQERFFAEVVRMNEQSIKNALNQATQKAIGELNIIKDNHLSVFNSIVLHKMSSLVDASIIVKPTMLATPIIVNLNLLNISAALSTPGVLEQNLWLKEAMKTPNLFADYNKIYFYITNPFNVVTQELLKAKSEIEVNSIKQTFLTNLNHLDEYFEYTEGSNNQSPSSQIQCKESLLEILEDISSKITGFNKMVVMPRVLEEEKIPNDDDRDGDRSELENAAQREVIPESEEALMRMIEQLRASLKQKDTTIDQQAGRIETQAEQIGDLNERLVQSESNNQELRTNVQELKQDKSDLRDTISILKESNLEKAARLEEVNETLVIKQSQYDILKEQFDSIIGLEEPQNLEINHDSQLLGSSNGVSIGSFEVI